MILSNTKPLEPLIVKAIRKHSGDGFKDEGKAGDVVFVYYRELPEPYAKGQYLRVGQSPAGGWTIQEEDWSFQEASLDEIIQAIHETKDFWIKESNVAWNTVARLEKQLDDLSEVALDYNEDLRSAHAVAERVAIQHGTEAVGTDFGKLHERVGKTLERHEKTILPYIQSRTSKLLQN
jgi:hypothetical protein